MRKIYRDTYPKKLFVFAIIVLLLVTLIPIYSLEVQEGRVKLILHEGTGRFSAYYLVNFKEKKYISFLVDQDPRTTVLSIVLGNRILRMGEAAGFKESAVKTKNGAKFVWKSNLVEITEDFTFVASANSPLATGIKITLTIKNISEQDLTVGVRYLFDTYLGEDSRIHFKTDKQNELVRELSIDKSNMIKYWISPASDKNFELESLLTGKNITTPDRVVFANWKRLNDSGWSYETVSSRNFNLLPYSINDSAVCQYYNPRSLKKGSSRTIVLLLGKFDKEGYDLSGKKTTQLNRILKKANVASNDISDAYILAQADLNTLNNLLAEIDNILKSENVSKEKIDFIKDILSDVEERFRKYSK